MLQFVSARFLLPTYEIDPLESYRQLVMTLVETLKFELATRLKPAEPASEPAGHRKRWLTRLADLSVRRIHAEPYI